LTRPRGLDVLTSSRGLNILTGARSLNVLTRPRGLDVLAGTRRLDILARARERPRGLDVLAATRGLNILTGPRSLNVLTRTREGPRRLDFLSLRNLLQHRLRLANFDGALGLRVGDRRQRRDDCRAHDHCEKSLHRSFHFPSFGLDWFDPFTAASSVARHPLGVEVPPVASTLGKE
jgi:hypothetical protein